MPVKDYKIRRRVYVPQPDGSKKEKVVYAHSEKQFTEKKNEILAEAEKAIDRANNPTFSEIALEWNEHHEAEISYNTWSSYQAPLNNLIEEFGDLLIKEITARDIQCFLDEMYQSGYAKQTINLRKITADLIFKYAIVEKGLSINNPVVNTKVNNNAKKQLRELPDDFIIEKVKDSVDKPFGLFAYLILFTGLRKSEAAALDYEDIDFANDIINVNKSIYYKNSKPFVKSPKTESGKRKLVLLSPLKNVLPTNKKGHIFANTNGEYLTRSQFTKSWYNYLNELDIELTIHQLRHAYATILYDAGVDVKTASSMLGHSKVETTLNIYTHIKKSKVTSAADKIEQYLSSNEKNNAANQAELITLLRQENENLRKQLEILQKSIT